MAADARLAPVGEHSNLDDGSELQDASAHFQAQDYDAASGKRLSK
jgi:hypothetical protein